MLISDQRDFEEMLERIEGCRALAIDTEFLREKTYYPKLCLVQLATDDGEFIVDPLALDTLAPMAKVLTDPRTVKIFHAGRQDREILHNSCGVVPSPVFDTQTAAPLLGMPQQAGYAAVVEELCGVHLKKLDSLTDWSARPLTNRQLEYSADDVRYLIPLYDMMTERLSKLGRAHWLDADFAAMSDPHAFDASDEDLWHKVKKASSLPRRQLVHAADIAVWRERIARRRDIPRKWVLPDELVVEISRTEPRTAEELFRIRGTREKLNKAMANEIVRIVAEGKERPKDEWPVKEKHGHTLEGADAVADALNAIVRLRAKDNGVAPQVLATHDELIHLANGNLTGLEVLDGWRYELVGKELLSFLDGKESVRVEGGKLVVVTGGVTAGVGLVPS